MGFRYFSFLHWSLSMIPLDDLRILFTWVFQPPPLRQVLGISLWEVSSYLPCWSLTWNQTLALGVDFKPNICSQTKIRFWNAAVLSQQSEKICPPPTNRFPHPGNQKKRAIFFRYLWHRRGSSEPPEWRLRDFAFAAYSGPNAPGLREAMAWWNDGMPANGLGGNCKKGSKCRWLIF